MTILAASQLAIMQLVGRKPNAVVSSTEEICVEITALAQEAATEIAKAYDWQNLIEYHTVTGDGAASSFPFPDDYDRMVQATTVFDPNNWCWGYSHVPVYGDWLQYQISGFGFIQPGIWTIRKNEFHFMPAPTINASAIFPYVTKNIFVANNGAPKSAITADNDAFVLDERLLTLALIWKWLALKRLDYQQEIDDYNNALSQEMTRDKGARTIRKNGASGRFRDVRYAWPWPLGGV